MNAPLLFALVPPSIQNTPETQIRFETQKLCSDFYCEGASFADFDKDGDGDVVAGPFWYEGPEYTKAHRIYEQEPFDPKGYSNNFFPFPRDFDGDGWVDVLVVGFPGEPAVWYENPRKSDAPWASHLVHPNIDNESPAFTDLTGDGREELVFHTAGVIGWAEPDRKDPRAPWIFHRLSENTERQRFTHGMGVGDVDGDGRKDVLFKDEWWQQPSSLAGDPIWQRHPVPFAPNQGGAQMFVMDVDGDGDGDVITSLEAHGFGLVWHEQIVKNGERTFVPHTIMGPRPEDSPHGLRIGELHAIDLADVNGDGLLDIVTGKRWWSHGAQGDPEPGAPAVVYWFELARQKGGAVDWIPHLVNDDSGVGVYVLAGDVDGDGLVDVVTGNKKGAYVHLQRRGAPSTGGAPAPIAPEDPREPPGFAPRSEDGRVLNFDFENGTLDDWTATGTAFNGQPVRGDTVIVRRADMSSAHVGNYWIGTYEIAKDEPQGTLVSAPFVVEHPFASFWLAGGRSEHTRVEFRRAENNKFIATASAEDHETLRPAVVDLSAELGGEVVVTLFDESSEGWGHINFDHLRLHDESPVFHGVEPLLPLDIVAHAGLPPLEAAAAMTVPDGFHVELVAGEPDVHQPVAFTIDERGRLWVVEAFSYPLKRPEGEGLDRVLIFEDADHDGSFETKKVFTEHLNLVSGIEVGFGGVWIGQAPELLFIPDRDHDDVPDGPPEVLLDGWGYQDTHETLNAFTWGPDGWLYGCHGVFTHSLVGKPGTPEAERTPIDAGIWRYHPLRRQFEVFAWGTSNPWGVDFDDDGQAFCTACVIPHLFHVIQGGRYVRQAGEHFDRYVFRDIQTIADHLHYLGGWSHGGNGRSNRVGGGHAHCGAMIYLGDSFPASYRDTIFFNNIHGNRVNTDLLEQKGSGYVGHHGADFLLANDRWFRGINLKYGPDGSVFLIDWYDAQACHTSDVNIWNRTNGRIYRVAYGKEPYRSADLSKLSSDELVGLQLQGNDWYVRTARRLLEERELTPETRRGLAGILRNVPDPRRKLRALWALAATGGLDEPMLEKQLTSEHAYLRAWAIQFFCENRDPSRAALDAFAKLAHTDPSPIVRLYLASALQRMPLEARWDIGEALLAHAEDASDANIPLLLWYGIEPLVPADPARALALASTAAMPELAGFLWRRAAVEPTAHEALVAALEKLPDDEQRLFALDHVYVALEGLRGLEAPPSWARLYAKLEKSADARVRDRALLIAAVFGDEAAFPALRALLKDPGADLAKRRLALGALARASEPETARVVQELVDQPELRGDAIRALARFDHASTPDVLLSRWASFSGAERADALATLASRPIWARELLGGLARGTVAKSDLNALVLRQLRSLGDAEVDEMLTRTWGVFRNTQEDKLAAIAKWKERLVPDVLAGADHSLGREVFAKTCMRCHVLFGVGGNIGPDITGANRSDLGYLLENVIDPNALIPREYQLSVVTTTDGRLVTGIEKGSDDRAVRLQTENELVVLARDEVETMRLDALSMMPEGQLETLREDEAIALFAYLQSDHQVPRLLTVENRASFFDGASLAGWSGDPALWSVEKGEIVGRAREPLAKNAFLVSDFLATDFKLSLDMRLVPNEANSGVQFRTEPLADGEVRGYQADAGAGWWGKLYEENGRALLAPESGEEHVHPGEWNHYEIRAVGDHVQTWINGAPCVDLHDPAGARRGQVALQVHAGSAIEVRFKNLVIEPEPAATTTSGSR
jgi:putative membrane-bound dehydrogenase-like protein